MPYIFEEISSADAEAYGLEAINQQVFVGRLPVFHWVIDRERNSYLRQVSRGRPDVDEGLSRWTFYWNGKLIWAQIEVLGAEWEGENIVHSRSRFVEVGPLDSDPDQQRLTVEALLEAIDAHTTRGGASQFNWHCEYEFAPGVLNVQA